MRKLIRLASAMLPLGLMSTTALAEYPDRPIVVVNPNSAGGGTDVGIRTWQPYVEKCLGGAALVPTAMPGAASAVGISALSQAAADGYTIGMVNMPNLVTNKLSKPEQPSIDGFVYIGNIIGVRSTLNVRMDSKFKTLQEAIAYMKSAGGPVNLGIGGIGADDHLVGLQLERLLGVKFNFIPFGSGADSRNALLGKQVEFSMMSNVEAAGFREEVRPLAVAADKRTDLFPDTPTFKEQDLDLVGGSTHVIAAPKGFPQEALSKWRECIQTAGKDPKFLEDAKKRSLSLEVMTGEQTETFVHDQAKLLTDLWKADPWIKP
ncbi:tripartite tricarboxylate transporter substrate binding protein [Sinorhizobium mexicanum]|uniref:Tripartite tricarboxylate transporter substrate binding protein n=1 Tax=Sinorhizobium mexicanum TaxID=375549 RepID=A0A859QG86_9HYPH|nr:tripartite tricarboxylate transporter substrate binding protein [Sinorhizobium mexicanum]MBP1888181.1 tripartite-type tricarboxylate transporter receptor subunit TctC [Sinorhizobium mexicanum]QLL62974.1 tripartite tricarboxylate transporter substrate binding protein [Sinorhizobium mexicanum]